MPRPTPSLLPAPASLPGRLLPALLSAVLLALVLAGCVEAPAAATPTATPQATADAFVPFNVSTPTPLPTPTPTPTPTPLADANLSAEETVRAYFDAVNAREYASAYGLVAAAFKQEDPDATTPAAFEGKLRALYPDGVTAAGIAVHPHNDRQYAFRTLAAGVARDAFFVLVQEDGRNRIRIPYPTTGLYYNAHARFAHRLEEQAFSSERALDDFFYAFIRDNAADALPAYTAFRLERKLETDGRTAYYETERILSFGLKGPGRVHVLVRATTDYVRYPYGASKQVNGRTLYINPTGAQGRWAEQAAVLCDNQRFLVYLNLDHNAALQFKDGAKNAYDAIAPALFNACPP